MDSTRLRPVVRGVTLVVATVVLSFSGGAPSWTDSIQPPARKAPSQTEVEKSGSDLAQHESPPAPAKSSD